MSRLDSLYRKMINYYHSESNCSIRFFKESRDTEIFSYPESLSKVIKSAKEVLDTIRYLNIKLSEYALLSIEIKLSEKQDGTEYIAVSIKEETDYFKLESVYNYGCKTSHIRVSPYAKRFKEILLFDDNVVVRYTDSSKWIPASISDFEILPADLQEIIFSFYSDNTAYRDFIREKFYLPVKISELSDYHSKKSYCEKLFRLKLPNTTNRIPFDRLYAVCCTEKYIQAGQLSMLLQNLNHVKDFTFRASIRNRKSIAEKYLKLFFGNIPNIDISIAEDYVNMAIELKQPIDITAGKKKIGQLHDELIDKATVRANRGIKLTIPETPMKYLLLPKEFTPVRTKKALLLEGRINHNCVGTYINRINKGRCVIYTADINGEHLTIEISRRRNELYVKQCRASYNRSPSEETKEYVRKCVKENSQKAFSAYNARKAR